MVLYIEVIIQELVHCAFCSRVLDKGTKAYIQVDAYYKERLDVVEVATCQECKDRNLGL